MHGRRKDIESQNDVLPQFKHISAYTEKELLALTESFQKTQAELENALNEHSSVYKAYLANHAIANYGSNITFIIYILETTSNGFAKLFNVFVPGVTIPNAVNYGISTPLSLIEVLFYMCVVSPKRMAHKDTWNYAFRDPWRKRLKDYLKDAAEDPRGALLGLLNALFDLAILGVTNLTGVMSELIFILPLVESQAAKVLLTIIVLYFGNEYYRAYTNDDWYNTFKNFFRQNDPSFIKNLSYSSLIEMILEYLSAVFLRVFPAFYYLAVESSKVLGFWFHPYLVLSCVSVHSLVILRDSTIDKYFKSDAEIIKILKQDREFQQIVTYFKCNHYGLGESSEEDIQLQLCHLVMDQHRKKLLAEEGYFFIFKKDRSNVPYFIVRGLISGYLFHGLFSRFISGVSEYILPPVAVIITLIPLYHSQQQLISNADLLKLMKGETQERSAKLTVAFAVALTFCGAVVGAMSTLGTLTIPGLDFVIAMLCLLRMINMMNYNLPKTEASVSDMVDGAKQSSCFARFFTPSNIPVVAQPDVRQFKFARKGSEDYF